MGLSGVLRVRVEEQSKPINIWAVVFESMSEHPKQTNIWAEANESETSTTLLQSLGENLTSISILEILYLNLSCMKICLSRNRLT